MRLIYWVIGRLYAWSIHRQLTHQQTVGDYVVVPPGYRGRVMHKVPTASTDPLAHYETVGWRLDRIQD